MSTLTALRVNGAVRAKLIAQPIIEASTPEAAIDLILEEIARRIDVAHAAQVGAKPHASMRLSGDVRALTELGTFLAAAIVRKEV